MRQLILCSIAFVFGGCLIPENFDELHSVPITMERTEVEVAVKMESSRPIKNAGPTITYQGVLYVSERYKGIHVIDISNLSSPLSRGFLLIPGNYHIAISGKLLIADNSSDLLTFDLSDPFRPTLRERARNVLAPPPAPYDIRHQPGDNLDRMVVDYKDTIIQYR